jgi:hypothetical protein
VEPVPKVLEFAAYVSILNNHFYYLLSMFVFQHHHSDICMGSRNKSSVVLYFIHVFWTEYFLKARM